MRRRLGIRGLGADASMYSMFDSQLKSYKDTLVSLYRKKTKFVAEREALRFQYLTGMKSKILGVFSAIFNQIFSDRNSDGEELTRHFLGFIQNNIPMVSINGGTLPGWGHNPYAMGGRLMMGYLSPITHFISEPFNDPSAEDQSPGYKIYGESYIHPSYNTEWVLNQYFLGGQYSLVYGVNEYSGLALEFAIPPSREWTEGFVTQRYGPSEAYRLINGYDYMASVVAKTYPAGNLKAVVDEARNMVGELVEKTKIIIRIQLDIDQAESDLANFVDEYKAYTGSNQSVEEILAALMLESQNAATLPMPEAVQEYSITTTNIPVPASEMVPTAIPVSTVHNKSSLPWVAGLAAVAFLALKGK